MALIQVLTFVMVWIAIQFGIIFGSLEGRNGYAFARTKSLVIGSIVQMPDGVLAIEPSNELRMELLRAPKLKVAVFEPKSGAAIAGSSPEIVAALAGRINAKMQVAAFELPADAVSGVEGLVSRDVTRHGPLDIGLHGVQFQWLDLFLELRREIPLLFTWFLPAILASTGTAWFVVRHGLEPLRAAANQAALIDLNLLDQPIATENVPIEVRPLIDAMNGALTRLDASAARMRRFTAGAAHELRTPVAILRARLENPKEPSFECDLLRDASRIHAIVEQMLITARMKEHQAPSDQPVDLVDAIWQVVADYTPLSVDCDRTIEFEASETPVMARCNRRAIECVVGNLIDNALRAEPNGGTVLVWVGDDASIEVTDHGEGVSTADREQIFEPFWRKSEATAGTGLGLAISKELVELQGGSISVEETPGGGATFIVDLSKRIFGGQL